MSRLPYRAGVTNCARPALAGLLLLGCSDSTAPPSQDGTQFGSVVSLSEFENRLADAPRVEIKLLPAGLTAREIDVEPLDAEEQIVSRAIAINPTDGTVTIELGGLVVHYTGATRFRTPASSQATRDAWETAVAASIASGRFPPIEARRSPAATPQAPGTRSSSPFTPPGRPLQGNVEFESRITSVNANASTFALLNGAVIQMSGAAFDTGGDLFTMASVAAAVNAGKIVRVEGRGTVQAAGPPMVITATTVRVEVDD